jgi:UDP-glucuronate 4-epimerase
MKNVLLTGCAGFIGYHTAKALVRDGHNVVGIDNLNEYYDPRLKQHRLDHLTTLLRFKFQCIDIENLDALKLLFSENKFDVIFNLGARAGVRTSIENPFIYLSTNATGSLNLLELAKIHSVPKFVLASTSSLYAGQSMPFSERLPVNTPISPYAASKKAAEMFAHSYYYLHGISVSITRYFTVYGPAGRPDMCIFRFIRWIDQGAPIEIFGDGQQSRDFTFVEDIANGTIAAGNLPGYEIINLGGGERPTSLLEIIQVLERLLGKKAELKFLPSFKADIQDTQADISKAKSLMGWQPKVDIEHGLKETVNWYLKNKTLADSLAM